MPDFLRMNVKKIQILYCILLGYTFLGIKYCKKLTFESFDNSMKLRGMTLMLFMDTHSTYG